MFQTMRIADILVGRWFFFDKKLRIAESRPVVFPKGAPLDLFPFEVKKIIINGNQIYSVAQGYQPDMMAAAGTVILGDPPVIILSFSDRNDLFQIPGIFRDDQPAAAAQFQLITAAGFTIASGKIFPEAFEYGFPSRPPSSRSRPSG
jgi:hypothetical protein